MFAEGVKPSPIPGRTEFLGRALPHWQVQPPPRVTGGMCRPSWECRNAPKFTSPRLYLVRKQLKISW